MENIVRPKEQPSQLETGVTRLKWNWGEVMLGGVSSSGVGSLRKGNWNRLVWELFCTGVSLFFTRFYCEIIILLSHTWHNKAYKIINHFKLGKQTGFCQMLYSMLHHLQKYMFFILRLNCSIFCNFTRVIFHLMTNLLIRNSLFNNHNTHKHTFVKYWIF